MTHAERKAALRSHALERRLAKGEEARARESRALCALIAASELFLRADCVLLYAPVRGEPDLSPLAELAMRRGIPVGYPRVEKAGLMTYRAVSDRAVLSPGTFGIPSPGEDAPGILPTGRTLLLVPALLGDTDGYRIGYGGGYFDRFLPAFPGTAVLVVAADELVPCLPTEENDVSVPYLVTPRGWHRSGGQTCKT